MSDDNNRKVYSSPAIARYYASLRELQPAEKVILDRLGDRLGTMKVLDLGVGGGRTTLHLARVVAEYTGLDYSPAMIATCKQRFPSLRWEVGDARDLSRFAENSFDFILFSFNGIDYMPPDDRPRVFAEVARVGKSGGYFAFSSHNLQGMEREFDLRTKMSWNPVKTYINFVMWAILRSRNRSLSPSKLAESDRALIYDEPHNFRLLNYYGRPRAQLAELKPFFRDVTVFSWRTGQEITDATELDANTDLWLYYLGVIR
jgi:ubiquinone/menaquinone biosynthesis C-methylase UbiE